MTVHEDLTRVIEGARDRSRKDFNVVKESYGQYLARAILASDVIAHVRAEAHDQGYRQAIRDATGEEYTGYVSSQYRDEKEAGQ
ncbi:MAG: hypothetical protein ACTH32_06405 [Microbacterium gubbeenense]|uniref:hypothetical protein n=1 Tax=Microbacterium gubbeenense TaxID=159896 RepID=UPI003F9CFB01